MLDEKSINAVINRLFPDGCFAWKLPSFIINTVTVIRPSGILRLIKMSPEVVQILTILL